MVRLFELSDCEVVVVVGNVEDAVTSVRIPHHRYYIPPQTAFGTVGY